MGLSPAGGVAACTTVIGASFDTADSASTQTLAARENCDRHAAVKATRQNTVIRFMRGILPDRPLSGNPSLPGPVLREFGASKRVSDTEVAEIA